MNDVCFTFDLDWAPERMVDELRELLEEHDLPATVFCTHRSPAVERLLARESCEPGLHPNFLAGGDPGAILARLRSEIPDASAVRNHALYYHSGLLALFHRAGLRVLSNDLMFLQPQIEPWYDWSGMVRLPIYWEDDVHCAFFERVFSPELLALERPGLKVLSFHPVHLCLNTRDLGEYRALKQDVAAGRVVRPAAGPGIRTLFEEVVRRVSKDDLATLGEVAVRFQEERVYTGCYASYLQEAEAEGDE